MMDEKDVKKDRYLTPSMAAETLSCSTSHIYRLVAQGSLTAIKIGGRAIRISEQSLFAFIGSNRFDPEEPYDPDPEEPTRSKPHRPPTKSIWMTK